MQIILLKDVPGVGRRGEVKNMADGYVRNFLLPRRLAAPATPGRLKSWQAESEQETAAKVAGQQTLVQTIRGLQGKEFTIVAKANEQGTLFSRVTVDQVSDILQAAGFKVPAKNLVLAEPLKRVGIFRLTATAPGVSSQFNLVIASLS
jgi:large subunit ribosomal protein L9